MNHDDIPLAANGPAYTSRQERHGVPLSYVGEMLRHAIEVLHRHGSSHPAQRQDLFASMHLLVVAYLGLYNMLAKANDRSLIGRLLEARDAELMAWLALVAREGDVVGLAGLDRP